MGTPGRRPGRWTRPSLAGPLAGYLLVLGGLILVLWSHGPLQVSPVLGTGRAPAPIGISLPAPVLEGALASALPLYDWLGPRPAVQAEAELLRLVTVSLAWDFDALHIAQPRSFLFGGLFGTSPPRTVDPASPAPSVLGMIAPLLPPQRNLRVPNSPWAVAPSPRVPPAVVAGRGPVRVGVYHTRSMESFYPALLAVGRGHPAFARSAEQAISVVDVGDALQRDLRSVGVASAHSLAVNDPQGIIGAYLNSLRTARALLQRYPRLELLLDLARGRASRRETTTRIHGHSVARVRIVVGSNRRLPHPRWRANLAMARRLQTALARLAPAIVRRIRISPDPLNQEVSPFALTVEIGGVDSTLGEEDRSAAYLARAIAGLVTRPGSGRERRIGPSTASPSRRQGAQ